MAAHADVHSTHAFPPTRHSIVTALAQGTTEDRTRAFDALARVYWLPIARYVERWWSTSRQDAEDLTQSFLAAAFEDGYFERFDPSRARFRTFVRVCVDRHVMKWLEREGRLKRGGDVRLVALDDLNQVAGEATTDASEQIFRDEWIRQLFQLALARLEQTLVERGNPLCFEVFVAYDVAALASTDGGAARPTYQALAERFGIPRTQVTNFLNLARRLLREIVVSELRVITANDAELRSEARALLGIAP